MAAAAPAVAAQNGAPPVAPVADAPARPASVPPPTEASGQGWKRLLLVGALGCVAIAAAFAISSNDPDSVSTAAPEPAAAATGPADEPAAAEVIGTWNGRVEIRYENGLKDHLAQTIEIARLNEDGPAGFSRSRQNGGTLRGAPHLPRSIRQRLSLQLSRAEHQGVHRKRHDHADAARRIARWTTGK